MDIHILYNAKEPARATSEYHIHKKNLYQFLVSGIEDLWIIPNWVTNNISTVNAIIENGQEIGRKIIVYERGIPGKTLVLMYEVCTCTYVSRYFITTYVNLFLELWTSLFGNQNLIHN